MTSRIWRTEVVPEEASQKCSSMMQTYLRQDPDSSEAIEFLCLVEGGGKGTETRTSGV